MESPVACEHVFVRGQSTILHADVDAFYASVEQRDDPRLRGRPVVVGGAVVLAASYEARAFGVRTAMGGHQALLLCPHAVVVPPRIAAYTAASRAVFEVFDATTPLVEPVSIDEAFLEVGGLGRVSGTPVEIAGQLRRAVLDRVGLRITVGVARTKFLAKVASGVAKPDGLLVVPPEGEVAFLHPLRVERLWGVGQVTARKLRERGITTSARSPLCHRTPSSPCSAPHRDATCTSWPTTVIRGRCASVDVTARWVRSTPWDEHRRHRPTSTPRSSPWSTG